jgi:peptidoglycan/LPS O-acetylase OafA/YrhL
MSARRVPELDALRGIAALAVVVQHLMMSRNLRFLGWSAVDMFFVLSGFLITTIILENGGQPRFLRTFYIRRSLRIWPIYYLALIGLVVASQFLHPPGRLDALPYYATYTQNLPLYWGGELPLFEVDFGHTWTLALEEQFYLIWPALLLLVGRRRLVPLALATIALSVAARGCGFHYRLLVGRMDGFALGGLLAALLVDPVWVHERRKSLSAAFVGSLALGVAYLAALASIKGFAAISRPAERIDYPAISFLAIALAYFGLVGLVSLHAGSRWLAPLRARWLCYLGLISYGIYLYHYPIQHWMSRVNEKLGIGLAAWYDAVTFAVCILAAVASWHLVEEPILRLKDRFNYGKPLPQSQDAIDTTLEFVPNTAGQDAR